MLLISGFRTMINKDINTLESVGSGIHITCSYTSQPSTGKYVTFLKYKCLKRNLYVRPKFC